MDANNLFWEKNGISPKKTKLKKGDRVWFLYEGGRVSISRGCDRILLNNRSAVVIKFPPDEIISLMMLISALSGLNFRGDSRNTNDARACYELY